MEGKLFGFIYITTNLINGKKYIGQRKLTNGWTYYFGSGKLIKMAIKKYGKENFKRNIVEYGYSQEELNNLEIKWINKYNAVENNEFYNLADGGKSGNKLAYMTDEEMNEYKEKLSRSIGNSEAHKKAIQRTHRTQEFREKISRSRKGKPLSEKAKAKLKTEKRLEACKNNIRIASKTLEKPVIQLSIDGEFIAEYSSITEAAKTMKVEPFNCSIGKCCGGKYQTAYGFLWIYKEQCKNIDLKKWATNKMLSNNGFIEYNGEFKTLAQWAKKYNIKHATLRNRLKKGWPIEKAFTTPLFKSKKISKNNHLITYNGMTKPLYEFAKEYGIEYKILWNRIFSYNWPIEKALVIPIRKCSK